MNLHTEYQYRGSDPTHDDRFLWRTVSRALLHCIPPPASIFEIDCGNGVNARRMSALGYSVSATNASASAIAAASSIPGPIRFEVANVNDPLPERFGTFDLVVALEVLEHLYTPRALTLQAYALLRPGGYAFLSTPYHGWLKNVLIAATGRCDTHFNPLWDHGHIKFFSPRTLRTLITEAGLIEVSLRRLGRVPVVARSMLAIVQRPAA